MDQACAAPDPLFENKALLKWCTECHEIKALRSQAMQGKGARPREALLEAVN